MPTPDPTKTPPSNPPPVEPAPAEIPLAELALAETRLVETALAETPSASLPSTPTASDPMPQPSTPHPAPKPPHPRLLILADSLAFHGPTGPMPADDPRLWPNVAATQLGGATHLFAGFGWTARDAWWALTGDPNIWSLLPKIDALVLGVGSMDTLPSPLPTYLRTGLRYLRPDGLRRAARKAYLAAQPILARTLGGRPVALPPALTVRYLHDTVDAIRALRPELPAVAILPATHRATSYGSVHTGHGPATAAISEWGEQDKIPLLDLTALTRDHVLSGLGNPDGMHWGWAAHQAVGEALASTLTTLGVSAPRPCCPSGPET